MKRSSVFHPAAGARRRKALGQNFLRNMAAADQIVEGFAPREGEPVLEIGSGRGVLTERLLAAGAAVVAVEVDGRLAARLEEKFAGAERFQLEVADARKADFRALLAPRLSPAFPQARVLANLPFSAGTEIVSRLLMLPDLFSSLTVMLQREVADRICAAPGGRTYGSLSVLSQYFTEPRSVMRLAPGSFEPAPKVHSAVVVMSFRGERGLSPDLEAAYPRFIRSLFHQRRRTLPHNLAPAWGADLKAVASRLGEMGIDPARRPETLTREECLRVYLARR